MAPALVKRTAAAQTAASNTTTQRAGGFKFTFQARTAEDVKTLARQTSGRDTYIASDVPFFVPADGLNTVRILPPPPALQSVWKHYGMRVHAHRDIGVDKGAYLCLAKMQMKPCPVCEERERANAAGMKDFAWNLRPEMRTLLYLIDRKSPEKGPQLWNISAGGKKSMDTDLLNLCNDPSDGSIIIPDHPDEGHDLSFTRQGTGLKTDYTGKRFSHRSSPISDVQQQYEKWLQYIIDNSIDQKLVYYEYDYIAHALMGQAPPQPAEGATAAQAGAAQQQQEQEQQQRAPLQRRSAPAAEQQQQPAATSSSSEPPPSWDDLQGMTEDALSAVVEYYKLAPPANGFAEKGQDGNDEVREFIARELKIAMPQAQPAPAAAQPAATGWKAALTQMTGK